MAVLLSWLSVTFAAVGQEPQLVLVGPTKPVPAGQVVSLWLHVLNPAPTNITFQFPARLPVRLLANGRLRETVLEAREPMAAHGVTVRSGGFQQHEYAVALPEAADGTIVLTVPRWPITPIALAVEPRDRPDPVAPEIAGPAALANALRAEKPAPHDLYDPGRFFKEHFFGYQPMYFIVGPDAPNAKFQISLRYQVFNRQGTLARRFPLVKGLNVAYTQTSLWDLSAPSAPFLDSSYKPEFLYLWQRVDRGRWADWFRLDLQGGFQHESNGKGGLDSRSLNLLYFWPQVVFGHQDGLQLKLAPRVWTYVGELDDNPDIARFRGYADLQAVLGWPRAAQLAAWGRIGQGGRRGSLQLDLTIPLMRFLSGNLSTYLHAQYFTGYGESLLFYNERSSTVRIGLGLYR